MQTIGYFVSRSSSSTGSCFMAISDEGVAMMTFSHLYKLQLDLLQSCEHLWQHVSLNCQLQLQLAI